MIPTLSLVSTCHPRLGLRVQLNHLVAQLSTVEAISLAAALERGSDDYALCLSTTEVDLAADGSGGVTLRHRVTGDVQRLDAAQALHAARLIDHAARTAHAGRAGRSAPYPGGHFVLEGLPQARPCVSTFDVLCP